MTEYNPENYWTTVAQEIQKRGENYIAGDDNPFYIYKRRKFLKNFLDTCDYESKVVLEVGFGPGGNLKHIAEKYNPKKLLGADISQTMLDIATKNLSQQKNIVELHKINGEKLPFPDQSVDTSYTVTVLQHITDETMFRNLVQELCRVNKSTIIIIEDIGRNQNIAGKGSSIGRQVDMYKSTFSDNNFEMSNVQFLNTKITRSWHHLICKYFVKFRRLISKQHHEGERMGILFKIAIGLPIPLTRILDDIYVEDQNLAKMIFHRV